MTDSSVEPDDDSDPDLVMRIADGPEIFEEIKRSKFYGQAFAVQSDNEAELRLELIRERFADAGHHCWGLRLGHDEKLRERYDDAGEPNRTAGAPILAAIQGLQQTDLLVIVTRYFGGVKLGKGGLIRAYGSAARTALAAAPRTRSFRTEFISIEADFQDVGTAEALLAKMAKSIHHISRDFGLNAKFTIEIRKSKRQAFAESLTQATSARIKINDAQ